MWRLASGSHGQLDGEGARRFGGRWNSPGVPVVYAASHLTLALLEQLVHFEPEDLPDSFRAFAIDLPEGAAVEVLEAPSAPVDIAASRLHGDAWAASLRSAALVVPSVVIPARLTPGDIPTTERNVVLNPRHVSAAAWRATETSFRVDPRLRPAVPPTQWAG